MTITTVNSATFDADSTIFIRDKLRDNITDPISATRPAGEKFVMTSYPQNPVKYPIITVKSKNARTVDKLGVGSELHEMVLTKEIRVWARTVTEKSELFQSVTNYLRSIEHDNDGTIAANLNDHRIISALDVDEDGDNTPKSKVIEVNFMFVFGA